jgi:hypothetical protein
LEDEEEAVVAGVENGVQVGYIYVVTHPFKKGLRNLWQQEKLNPRTKSYGATTAVAITW